MLTRKQLDLLNFLQNRIRRDGYAPSFEEMREAMQLKSKSGIHRMIGALEERGFVRRLPNRARALEVLKCPVPNEYRAKSPNVDFGIYDGAYDSGSSDNIMVPLMGRIAAGSPIEAISNKEADVEIPSSMLGGIGEHFALSVSGDSMIDAGIHDNDTVIIRRQATADNGDIIVALINSEEATLKKLRRKGSSIALEAANPAFEPRFYRPDEVQVQGKLVALYRSY